MVTVKDIIDCVQEFAPVYMKESWDHVGLNCGHLDAPVDTVLIALDPFAPVCREAKEIGAQLLVTHHALLWEPGFITDETVPGSNTLFLIENGIAHFNAHTNLDCAPGGVNDTLAATLGLTNIQVISPVGTDGQNRPYGLLRQGEIQEQSLEDFLSVVKTKLGCKGLRYVNCGKPVHKVTVGGGACAGSMKQAIAAGCDTFVTADVRYNQFVDARDLGINLIDAGHFHTENPVCQVLADLIQAKFPGLRVEISKNHTDHMNFFT